MMRKAHPTRGGLAEREQASYRPASPVGERRLTWVADYEGQHGVPVTPDKFRSFRLRMEPNGRVVIPAELRALWSLSADCQLVARFRNGELVLTTPQNGVRLAQAILAPYKRPGVNEVDEFLKERGAMWGEENG